MLLPSSPTAADGVHSTTQLAAPPNSASAQYVASCVPQPAAPLVRPSRHPKAQCDSHTLTSVDALLSSPICGTMVAHSSQSNECAPFQHSQRLDATLCLT